MNNDPIDEPEWWRSRYSGVEPSGHTLRAAFPDRWFRIHSLPQSKRYPDNVSDWKTLIARHRSISDAVLGAQPVCYLVTPWWCWKESCFSEFELRAIPSLPEYRPAPDELPSGGYYGARVTWNFERFEPVLRDVAEDKVRTTVILENEPAAYAPYDGGADLFLPNKQRRDSLREDFKKFLSSRPDGL